MTEDEAYASVSVLVNTTPGPWNDAVVEQWVEAFMRLDQPNVLRVVCQRIAERYVGNYRLSLGEVVTTYHEQVKFVRVRSLPSGIAQCDGSGWLGSADGLRPCPRCNPAIATTFRDDDLLARYRDGTPLHELGVGVEKNRGGKMRFEHGDPPQCHPATLGGLEVVDPARGWQIALDAYEAECRSMGRDPKRSHFTAMAGGR